MRMNTSGWGHPSKISKTWVAHNASGAQLLYPEISNLTVSHSIRKTALTHDEEFQVGFEN